MECFNQIIRIFPGVIHGLTVNVLNKQLKITEWDILEKDKINLCRRLWLILKSKLEKRWKVQKKHLEFNLHLKVCTKSGRLYPLWRVINQRDRITLKEQNGTGLSSPFSSFKDLVEFDAQPGSFNAIAWFSCRINRCTNRWENKLTMTSASLKVPLAVKDIAPDGKQLTFSISCPRSFDRNKIVTENIQF